MKRLWQLLLVSGFIGLLTHGASAQQATLKKSVAATPAPGQLIGQLIIKYKDDTVQTFSANGGRSRLSALAQRATVPLTYKRPMSGMTHVVGLPAPTSRAEAVAISKRLEMDANVEYAEVDEWLYPTAIPDDPAYGNQWHYFAPDGVTGNAGGINAPRAWDITRGQGVTIAVIDTGYTNHPDLLSNLVMNGSSVGGYDFISDATNARDGDGRDADASDPGNWRSPSDCAAPNNTQRDSNWHGTHVAGTIAAVTNNGTGVAGVAYEARVLPLRVIGRCGGLSSDTADAIRWAAGLPVPGIPNNPNVARVVNLSLGSSSACSMTTQAAINDARTAGAVIVAATGNDGDLTIGQPANCLGVIAVTSHTFQGDSADYANVGPGTSISAPGGGACTMPNSASFTCATPAATSATNSNFWVLSTLLYGITTPTSLNAAGTLSGPTYTGYVGTSMATPHVSGAAALLLARMPTLTPDEVKSLLVTAVRPFPAGTYCTGVAAGTCGSGMLDARAALDLIATRTPALTAAPSTAVVSGGSTATLSAAATPRNGGSASFSYQWTQTSGPAVQLNNATSAIASFVGVNPGGTHSFNVAATDSNGYRVTEAVSIRSNNAPTVNAPSPGSVAQGSGLTINLTASDPENDALVYVATNLPAGATLEAATGRFSWQNVTAAVGSYSFNVMANDGTINSAGIAVSVNVTAPPAASGGGGGGAMPWSTLLLLGMMLIGSLLPACSTAAQTRPPAAAAEPAPSIVAGIIVKPREPMADGNALMKAIATRMASPPRVQLSRPMSGGAYVLSVLAPASERDVPAIIAELKATNLFSYVEEDGRLDIR